MAGDDLTDVVGHIDGDSFREWYREREFAKNIREGKPYFNGPSPVPDAERHSPSNLMQCHRKIVYQQENAPEERPPPEGIFWTGRRFEEDIIVPYLQDVVVGDETYVRNSMWVDERVDVDGTEVRFKGSTDPAIVTAESEPLVVTEVKTKSSLDGLSSPNRHHRAQVHAYMYGLSESWNRDVSDAVIIYGSRTSLDVQAFHEPFDPEFWSHVLDWAADHTQTRQSSELPPATPEYDWECKFCSYKHRCGKGNSAYKDEPPAGLLSSFVDYPRDRLIDYLRSHDGDRLTPALAKQYPDLAERYGVRKWVCPQCEHTEEWNGARWSGDSEQPPVCSRCASEGELSVMQVRRPTGTSIN